MKRLVALLLLISTPAWAASAFRTYFVNNVCGDCVAYWPMDETSGTTLANACTQSCGLAGASSFDMTTSGSPTLNSAGANAKHAGAVAFTAASSQYAEAANDGTGTGIADLNQNITGSCWAKLASATASDLISVNNTNVVGTAANNWDANLSTGGAVRISIRQNTGGSVYLTALGGTGVGTGVWGFFSFRYVQATPSVTVYLNGVSDGTSSSTTGTITANSQKFIDIATRPLTGNQAFMDGSIQDCFLSGQSHAISPSSLLNIYNQGILTTNQVWPHLTALPEPPRFMDDNYFEYAATHGYNTGHFEGTREIQPTLLNVGYANFAIMPWGNTGRRR